MVSRYRCFISAGLFGLVGFIGLVQVPISILALGLAFLTTYDVQSVMMVLASRPRVSFGQTIAVSSLWMYTLAGTIGLLLEYGKNRVAAVQVLIIVGASDAIQYIVGKTWGRYHINPVSSGKTLEGYIGAIVAPMGILVLNELNPYFQIPGPVDVTSLAWIESMIILGFIGDALVSIIKRCLDLKDVSNLLGPQGGWIDRLDSAYVIFIVLSIHRCLDMHHLLA